MHQAKRKAALKRKQVYADERAVSDLFPEIVIEPGDAPGLLVDAVRSAVKRVRIEHATLLHPNAQLLFRVARERGFEPMLEILQLVAGNSGNPVREAYLKIMEDLSENIFRLMSRDLLAEYARYHCVDIMSGKPQPNGILVRFRSLLNARSSGGTVYYTRRRPTLVVGGQEKVVAFSRHAIERIDSRTVDDPLTYGGASTRSPFSSRTWTSTAWASSCSGGSMTMEFRKSLRSTGRSSDTTELNLLDLPVR